MTYDLKRMNLSRQVTNDLQRIFGYLTMLGGKPLAFGPYVAAAFLGRKDLPFTIQVLVDSDGRKLDMPNGWRRTLNDKHEVATNKFSLTSYDMCSVPKLDHHRVRLYHVTPRITDAELAVLQELTAEQVVFGPNTKGPIYTRTFRESVDDGLVRLARPWSGDEASHAVLLERGRELAMQLGLAGVIKPTTKVKPPARTTMVAHGK